MISKAILKEEIKKTKEAIKAIEAMSVKSNKQNLQIQEDCGVGLQVNRLVLGYLETELKK